MWGRKTAMKKKEITKCSAATLDYFVFEIRNKLESQLTGKRNRTWSPLTGQQKQ
jgi:hypothetical protein